MTDFIRIDAFLSSDDAHPDSMAISDLDGFLTGIACSPEPVPDAEWLDRALGRANNTPDEIVAAVCEMLQGIRDRLQHHKPLDPFFWETEDGTIIAMDWCEGFMDAVKMRPERWDAFAQTDTGAKLMLPILAHMIDENGNSEMDISQEDLASTLDAAAEAIPTVVPAIYRHIRMITTN